MKLLIILNQESNTKNLEFYRNFGIEKIFDTKINKKEEILLENKNLEDHKNNKIEIAIEENKQILNNNRNGKDEYKFETSDIPLELTEEEFTIFSTAEILLRESMQEKNRHKDQSIGKIKLKISSS